jgi:hypothetical protein
MSTEPNPPFIVCTRPNGKRILIMVSTIKGIIEATEDDHENAGCIIQTNDYGQAYVVADSFQQVLDTLYRIHAPANPVNPLDMVTKMMQQLGGEDPNGVH